MGSRVLDLYDPNFVPKGRTIGAGDCIPRDKIEYLAITRMKFLGDNSLRIDCNAARSGETRSRERGGALLFSWHACFSYGRRWITYGFVSGQGYSLVSCGPFVGWGWGCSCLCSTGWSCGGLGSCCLGCWGLSAGVVEGEVSFVVGVGEAVGLLVGFLAVH